LIAEAVRQVRAQGAVPALMVTLAEFMPERDIDGQGALLVSQFLTALIGVIARQV
jgi:agmatinase